MAWAISGPTVGGPQWLDVHAVSGPPDVALCGPIVAELLASWGANGGWLSGHVRSTIVSVKVVLKLAVG